MKKLIVGDIQEATNEFLRWNKANGKELEGLNRRRQAKRRLFLSDISVCQQNFMYDMQNISVKITFIVKHDILMPFIWKN